MQAPRRALQPLQLLIDGAELLLLLALEVAFQLDGALQARALVPNLVQTLLLLGLPLLQIPLE